MIWLSNSYNTSLSSSHFVSLFLSLYILAFLSLRSDLRTSLRTVSGPRQKRINLKTMSSLPNSPWLSPHRQRVSVWLVCFYYCCYHVVFHSNEQCLSHLPPLSPRLHVYFNPPVLLPSATKGKNLTHTHFHLVLFFTHLLQPFSPFPSSAWRTHCAFTLFNNAVSKQHLTQVHE